MTMEQITIAFLRENFLGVYEDEYIRSYALELLANLMMTTDWPTR